MEKNKQLVKEFLTRLYGGNKSEQTIKNYGGDLRQYLEFLGQQPVIEVDLQKLEEYTVHLRKETYGDNKRYSDSTISRKISSVRSFYNYLRLRGLINKSPADDLEAPTRTKGVEPAFIEEARLKHLINATRGETHEVRDRLILGIFITTGIRLSELQSLNVQDQVQTCIQINKGKGNKNRKVYISESLAQEIEDYKKDNNLTTGALFISQKGTRISVRSIQRLVEKYMKKVGLDTDKYTTHTLRHSCASLMLQKGVNIVAIQESLGHSSLETTQKYAHTLSSTRQEAANLVSGVI